MKLGKTSDTSAASHVYEISNELDNIFLEIEDAYKKVDIEIFFVFRCIPDSIGRKSMRRYSKKEGVLYLDMVFSEDELKSLSKDEQRVRVSQEFFRFLGESLGKYDFPGLDACKFFCDFRESCKRIGW